MQTAEPTLMPAAAAPPPVAAAPPPVAGPASPPRAAGRWFYGWVVVAVAFVTSAASLGTRAAYGVLLVPVADGLGWSRGVVAGAIALNFVLWAVSAAPVGALLDRFGPRLVFAGAAAVTGLGLVLAASSQEVWQFYLGIGVLGGIGLTPLVANSQTVIIANWFVRRRGLANGLAASGVGVGMLVLAPLTHWVVERAGWQAGCLVLAGLFLLIVASLNAVAQRWRPADCGLLPDGAATRPTTPPPAGPNLNVALHHPRYWLLVASCLPSVVAIQFLIVHGVAYLGDVGVSAQQAATTLGVSGACAALGMLLLGYLADRWSGEWAFTIGTGAMILAIGVMAVMRPGQEVLLLVYAALFGLGFAARMGALSAFMLAALARGPAFGTLNGIMQTQMAVGAAICPMMGGWVFDHTGSYQLGFPLAAVCAALSIVLAWLAAPRHGLLMAPASAVARNTP